MEITHFERMSLNGLCSNSLILNRGQAFRGRERISLSVHACHHTFAYSLLFFSNSFFFLSKFSSPFSLFLLFPCGVVMFTLAFLSCCSILLVIFSVHGRWPFYTAYREEYLLFYPELLLSGCGCPSRPPIGLSAAQRPPLTCVSRATSHYQTKSLILFACSLCHSYPDKGGHSLLLSLMTCT